MDGSSEAVGEEGSAERFLKRARGKRSPKRSQELPS